jgi:hypothetical protein
MLMSEILNEGAIPVAGRTGNKVVRKYRCTTGSRKGRVVAKPGTCNAPRNVKKSVQLKTTKRRQGSAMKVKINRTKRAGAASSRLKKANVGRRHKERKPNKAKRI